MTDTSQTAVDAANEPFEKWWQAHGQFCRAGGGDYEKTFAYRAWVIAQSRQASAQSAAPVDVMTDAEQAALYEFGKGTPHLSVIRRICRALPNTDPAGFFATPPASVPAGDGKDAMRYRFQRDHHFQFFTPNKFWRVTDDAGKDIFSGRAYTYEEALDAAMLASKAESVKGGAA